VFKKILSSLTNVVLSAGIVVLAVFVILSFFETSRVKEKLALLNASIEAHSARINTLTEENKAWAKENESLVKEISGLKEESEAHSAAIARGMKEAKELADNRPPAPVECKEIVEYMQKEIDAYVENFSLAIRDRDTWKTIAGDFDLAYQNQVKITVNLQTTIDLVSSDSRLKDEIIKDLQKDLKISKVKGNLFAGGMVAIVVAAVIFGMFK